MINIKYLGYIFLALVIFVIGFMFGAQPSGAQQQEKAQNQAYVADMRLVAQDGQQAYNLCEQKYQTAIKGDLATATRMNGQIDVIVSQMNQILAKYNRSAL